MTVYIINSSRWHKLGIASIIWSAITWLKIICLKTLPTYLTVILLAMFLHFQTGCNSKSEHTVTHSSVSDLVSMLPNFTKFDIKSCNYTLCISESRSTLPSPSETKLELNGFACLSKTGYENIVTGYKWKHISPLKLPDKLQKILPEGEILFSSAFNDTFESNPTYTEDIAVIMTGDVSRKLFFIAVDLDSSLD